MYLAEFIQSPSFSSYLYSLLLTPCPTIPNLWNIANPDMGIIIIIQYLSLLSEINRYNSVPCVLTFPTTDFPICIYNFCIDAFFHHLIQNIHYGTDANM